MFEFFDLIVNLIDSIKSAFVSLIDTIISIYAMIASGAVAVVEVYSFLPNIIRFFVGALISYCVIINILNKGG